MKETIEQPLKQKQNLSSFLASHKQEATILAAKDKIDQHLSSSVKNYDCDKPVFWLDHGANQLEFLLTYTNDEGNLVEVEINPLDIKSIADKIEDTGDYEAMEETIAEELEAMNFQKITVTHEIRDLIEESAHRQSEPRQESFDKRAAA